MAGSFKYRLGLNELSSRKHRLWNSLVAEFVGKFYQINQIKAYSKNNRLSAMNKLLVNKN